MDYEEYTGHALGRNLAEALEIVQAIAGTHAKHNLWFVSSDNSKHIIKLIQEQREGVPSIRIDSIPSIRNEMRFQDCIGRILRRRAALVEDQLENIPSITRELRFQEWIESFLIRRAALVDEQFESVVPIRVPSIRQERPQNSFIDPFND